MSSLLRQSVKIKSWLATITCLFTSIQNCTYTCTRLDAPQGDTGKKI